MQGLGPPPWATFTGMSGQPTGVGNPQAFQLGGVDPNGMILGTLPGYVRLAPNNPQSSLHTTTPYGSANQPLGYALPHSMEASLAGRQLNNTNLPPSYQLPTFPLQNGSTSQSLPFSHPTLQCGQSPLPYFHQLMPSLCNGGLGAAVQHCSTVNSQTSLLPGAEPLRFLDSLKHFSTFPSDQKRRAKPMTTSRTNLYISGLCESDTDETVRCLVKDVVQPKSCKAVVCNGICKGYGFIDCASDEDAEKAIAHILEYARASGRKLMVKFAYENEKDALNVYVKHLPLDYSKDNLKNLFREYGQITSVKLLEKESGPTGDGFVRYTYSYEASKAIEELNSKMLVLGTNSSPVLCKLADKANTRRRDLIRSTTDNHQGLTAALFQSAHLPLANQTPIRASTTVNTVTGAVYRGPTHPHLAQQPSTQFTSTLPFTTSQLHPVQLMLHNMQCGAGSPQLRNVLSPGGMTNGSSNATTPSTINPISSSAASVASVHQSALPNRSTPLMGPPPPSPTITAAANSSSTTPPIMQPPCLGDVEPRRPVDNDSITEESTRLCETDKSSVSKITDATQPKFGMTSPNPVTTTSTSPTINVHEHQSHPQIYHAPTGSEIEANTASTPTFCSFSSQPVTPSTQPNCELSLIAVSTTSSPTIHSNFPVQATSISSKEDNQPQDISSFDRKTNDEQLIIVCEPEKMKNDNSALLTDVDENISPSSQDHYNNLSDPDSHDADTMNGSSSLSFVSSNLQSSESDPKVAIVNLDHSASQDLLSGENKLVENHSNNVHRSKVKDTNNSSNSGPNVSTQCDQ